jgi:glycosyltransferase involved in cell wall biosynthesis
MIIALDARPLLRSQFQGVEQRARNILAAWVRSGVDHQFHLLYPRPAEQSGNGGGDTTSHPYDESLLTSLPANFHREAISAFHIPARMAIGTRLLNPLIRALRRIKPDIYFAFDREVPRLKICPVVPTYHDLACELDPAVSRMPASRHLRRTARLGIREVRRVNAVSSQTKYDIASVYGLPPERIDVIYNGIDPAFTPLPPSTLAAAQLVHVANNISAPYLLTVGADIPRRNYARMLAAMQIVWSTPDGARTKWVLAGRDQWERSPIYAAARRAGVLDRMRFVATPGNAELADLYRGAMLTVCASSFEGFGLSVLESMACGAAVACSDMRSLREVAADAVVYFPHDDAQSMGQAIAGLLEDAEYRRQLKYRGLQRATLFTWDVAAQLTLDSLQAACRQPGEVVPVIVPT